MNKTNKIFPEIDIKKIKDFGGGDAIAYTTNIRIRHEGSYYLITHYQNYIYPETIEDSNKLFNHFITNIYSYLILYKPSTSELDPNQESEEDRLLNIINNS